MGSMHLIYYAFPKLQFPDVETITDPWRSVPAVRRILYSKVRGLSCNLSELTEASSPCEIQWCSEICVSDIYVTRRSCWFQGLVVLSCCAGAGWLGPQGWLHRWELDIEHDANPNVRVAAMKLWLSWFVARDRNFVCLVLTAAWPRWPEFDCFLTSMAALQPEDVHASFLFVCDLNGHHQDRWVLQPRIVMTLGSTTSNRLDCVWFRSVGCRPDPHRWWDTWPPDDRCSWPSTGCCCSTHR